MIETCLAWLGKGLRRLAVASLLAPAGLSGLAARECALQAIPCCAPAPDRAGGATPLALGLQIWPEDISRSESELLAMKPAAFRYSGGPSWQQAPRLSRSADFAEALAFVRRAFDADAEKYRRQAEQIAAFARKSGAKALFVIWEPPATDADPPAMNPARDARVLRKESLRATAHFYVAALRTLRDFGYPVDMVELSNEPDGEWNIRIAPSDYAELLRLVRESAREQGLATPPIAGPGTSTIAALSNYLRDDATARAMLQSLDAVSAHAWDDRASKSIVGEASAVKKRLQALGYSGPVVISEFALTFLRPEDRGAGRGAHLRSAEPVSDQPLYAARSIETALSLANLGFGPILFWEFQDPGWGKASYGLRDRDGRARPSYAPWRRLSELARAESPLYVRPQRDAPFFMAGDAAETKTLVLINPGEAAMDVTIANDGSEAGRLAARARDEARPDAACSISGRRSGFSLQPGEIRILP